jgi:hypothetical protein
MFQPSRTELLVEALEFYIQDLKKNDCTEASIQAYTTLLKEIDVDNYSVID